MIRTPPASDTMTIGLLGGSFNPPHMGHRHISLIALKRLGLDRIWWIVTPGNPLKSHDQLAPLAERMAQSRALARHPRIDVTSFETDLPAPYSYDTIRALRRRFPATGFVWVIGADNLADFHRWRNWEGIFSLVPIAVIDRPGYRLRAWASKAARKFRAAYIEDADAKGLALQKPPAWTMLSAPLSSLSSTEIRGIR